MTGGIRVTCDGFMTHSLVEFVFDTSNALTIDSNSIRAHCPVCALRADVERLNEKLDKLWDDQRRMRQAFEGLHEMKQWWLASVAVENGLRGDDDDVEDGGDIYK